MELNSAEAEEKIQKIRAALGKELSRVDILRALSLSGNGIDAAVKFILDTREFWSRPVTVKRTVTSTGARVSAQIKQEPSESEEVGSIDGSNSNVRVKEEPDVGFESKVSDSEYLQLLPPRNDTSIAPSVEFKAEASTESEEAVSVHGSEGKIQAVASEHFQPLVPEKAMRVVPLDEFKPEAYIESEEAVTVHGSEGKIQAKEEPNVGIEKKVPLKEASADSERRLPLTLTKKHREMFNEFLRARNAKVVSADEYSKALTTQDRELWHEPSKMRKGETGNRTLSSVVVEDGDFPEEQDWLLVGRTMVTALSTTKGTKLVDNEIVHFSFPSADSRSRYRAYGASAKAGAAASGIVRFSTKRSGEIGRLPMEWAKCLIPLVNSKKVKVLGRCVAAPTMLHLMQEIILYLSFYVHHSIFTEGDTSSWRLDASSNIDSTVYPLPTLFKVLKIKPYQKAEFTPEDLDSRKRSLILEQDYPEEASSMLPIVKRRKDCQQFPEQNKDEQAISESSVNKLVGAADVYNLEEMEGPSTLTCELKPYQKQALYWMSESEKGIDVEKAAETLHPCWAAYSICDQRASSIYVNIFSGEATAKFPTATQMARGGILADAMGLGKTVMTIALILARPGRGNPDNQRLVTEAANDSISTQKNKKDSCAKVSKKARGGTLVICPMALLGQWKDELETHSEPESLSIFVHYGGYRTNDPKVMAEHDVVLTTYGVLTAAYKNHGEDSIFHRVDWYRVVLDEAHTIKSSRTQGAQAAFKLSSHCRWCLTGTPLQNNLEDLYSLLCFLRVEPWCNWAWWSKLIQKPYECGDQRGLRLIKAILRPLMLRRTKDTKDKQGRPILTLPATDIQIIECEQSEAEHHFYNALFKRSKVQFDQFVAQGKVLHNYASILELLLRLRQCCNHPFLVMSRVDSQKYADLNKLARRFLEGSTDSESPNHRLPTRAYVEEVVEGIRRGENMECPICLEYADDPVLTPCAHRMCRECLLSSWRTPLAGACPICRQPLRKNDLITCPSENKFRVDVEENWKESSKVSKLLNCLEWIGQSRSGEKSIVFSQWTSFFDLLEIALRDRGIGFLRFDGKLAQKSRELVLKEFSQTKDKMVLLMSLKAGGVGLNLTAASHVFIMDPWWNPAVEEQAIMRIHRIGQKRTVRVRRFIVKDTVEERMQQVQARKQRMIAGALTDDEVRTARIEELKMLFR
ncbi:DNA repair protein RAD5B isoform X2 [Malania oleifera]|uniref:DNA repair protein RAD5B isoform X2 n=1 Tax=Malania oleifera TaxID=397392 RepID=UPI0025ADEEDA|nr:DNA repair protein RAD5B isoform X2 [Malania oleifera]